MWLTWRELSCSYCIVSPDIMSWTHQSSIYNSVQSLHVDVVVCILYPFPEPISFVDQRFVALPQHTVFCLTNAQTYSFPRSICIGPCFAELRIVCASNLVSVSSVQSSPHLLLQTFELRLWLCHVLQLLLGEHQLLGQILVLNSCLSSQSQYHSEKIERCLL